MHTESAPCLTQTGNMLRKFALYFLDLLFERLDSLAYFGRELLRRLQKQLAQLSLVWIELLYPFLVFTSLTRFSQQAIFNNRVKHHAFVAQDRCRQVGLGSL